MDNGGALLLLGTIILGYVKNHSTSLRQSMVILQVQLCLGAIPIIWPICKRRRWDIARDTEWRESTII